MSDQNDDLLAGIGEPAEGEWSPFPATPVSGRRARRARKEFRDSKKSRGGSKKPRAVVRPTKAVTEQQVEAYRQVLRGRPIQDVADSMGITRQTLSNIFSRVELQLVPEYIEDIRRIRVKHSERLELIISESFRAWDKSLRNRERVVTKTVLDKGGNPFTETTRTVEGQSGDARHLQTVMEAMRQMREIWGADEPMKVEHDITMRVAGMPRQELRERAAATLRKIAATTIDVPEAKSTLVKERASDD